MSDLVPLAPMGAGAITHADSTLARQSVSGSRALYLLDHAPAHVAAKAITVEMRAALPVALASANARLQPTPPADVMMRLAPVLTLTAGAGMTGGARAEWLAAAADALKGIPFDLLERGIRAARSTCDHPSKIIPAILADVKDAWRDRLRERGMIRRLADLADNPPTPPAPVERCTPAEAQEIMAEFGIRPDTVEPRPLPTGGTGLPGRQPTRDDYLRMGVAPEVLDAIEAEASAPREDR